LIGNVSWLRPRAQALQQLRHVLTSFPKSQERDDPGLRERPQWQARHELIHFPQRGRFHDETQRARPRTAPPLRIVFSNISCSARAIVGKMIRSMKARPASGVNGAPDLT
jgi:hypothetical protein